MTIEQVEPEAGSRKKTISWQDPMPSAAQARTMSGLRYLTGIAEGEIPPPPIAAHFGMRWVSVGDGDVVLASTPDESVYNPIGTVHGGVAATMLDSAVACAVHSTLQAGVGYTTVELKISYLRPILASSGELLAHGWVVESGARVAFAEGDVRDAEGTVLATASSTCLILGA